MRSARTILILSAIAVFTAGCQPFSKMTPGFLKSKPVEQQQVIPAKTFEEAVGHTQADPLEGKVMAEMAGEMNPELQRYAFVTADGRPIFAYQESADTVRLLIGAPDGSVKQVSFAGYKLDKSILNKKILYIGSNGEKAVKFNVDSFDYSEVDRNEMERARVVLDEIKIPGEETPVFSQEGFLYTREGFIFDLKKYEYLLDDHKEKKKFYEKADVAYGNYLFEIQPRQDQAINLKTILAKGDKTALEKTYPIQLDLQEGYDVRNLDSTMGLDGTLYLFAVNAQENEKTVVKMFQIPLGTFEPK